ncbi:TIGR02611 family protein [Cryobacterium lactosi]|uniref:TIGR02611 family protein n=1 Tax=Cryobacterium lactosi TaxID=1259202 RepID=A0A4V3IXQ0_9MICO|nr:TIGR02611 family protein [Cryobacterium lactosi]TFD91755.1 TIGR02611 family protein [Cryobacterium lactosi]
MSTPVSQPGAVEPLHPADPHVGPGPRGIWQRVRALLRRSRAWIHRHPHFHAPYRLVVALAGLTVVVVGLILVPLPGPGWLIVFVGVAILGTEFPAAHRLTQAIRRLAHRVRLWWRARHERQSTRAYS